MGSNSILQVTITPLTPTGGICHYIPLKVQSITYQMPYSTSDQLELFREQAIGILLFFFVVVVVVVLWALYFGFRGLVV